MGHGVDVVLNILGIKISTLAVAAPILLGWINPSSILSSVASSSSISLARTALIACDSLYILALFFIHNSDKGAGRTFAFENFIAKYLRLNKYFIGLVAIVGAEVGVSALKSGNMAGVGWACLTALVLSSRTRLPMYIEQNMMTTSLHAPLGFIKK